MEVSGSINNNGTAPPTRNFHFSQRTKVDLEQSTLASFGNHKSHSFTILTRLSRETFRAHTCKLNCLRPVRLRPATLARSVLYKARSVHRKYHQQAAAWGLVT